MSGVRCSKCQSLQKRTGPEGAQDTLQAPPRQDCQSVGTGKKNGNKSETGEIAGGAVTGVVGRLLVLRIPGVDFHARRGADDRCVSTHHNGAAATHLEVRPPAPTLEDAAVRGGGMLCNDVWRGGTAPGSVF